MSATRSRSDATTTGRMVVLLEEGAAADASERIARVTGRPVVETRAASGGILSAEEIERGSGLVFSDLDVAVVELDARQAATLAAEAEGVVAIEPERIVTVDDDPGAPGPTAGEVDEAEVTWGLQAVGARESDASGSGVAVAVLDTGIDRAHPDFEAGRVVARSFVEGQDPQDGHGHGTHCIGTACGPASPAHGPRYGVAPEAQIYAGKVLSDGGSGTDAGILAGIEWALGSGCQIVSMSLGARVQPGDAPSQVFETVARRALRRDTLLVAAAGNDSRRQQGFIVPVSHPANCPSILAVGAVDSELRVADFSNRGIERTGGQLDFAAPGVGVYSAWTMPTRYNTVSGTSMATPHVAGTLALLADANPNASAEELTALAFRTARRLESPSWDVGAGLIQAP